MTEQISILVRLFGVLRECLAGDAERGEIWMTVSAGVDAAAVLAQLGLADYDGPQLVVMVNGRPVEGTRMLEEGDVLSAFPALAGG